MRKVGSDKREKVRESEGAKYGLSGSKNGETEERE